MAHDWDVVHNCRPSTSVARFFPLLFSSRAGVELNGSAETGSKSYSQTHYNDFDLLYISQRNLLCERSHADGQLCPWQVECRRIR